MLVDLGLRDWTPISGTLGTTSSAVRCCTPEQREGTIMPTEDDRRGGVAPDRDRQDQPVRDDMIDPRDIDPGEVREPTMDEETGDLSASEQRPESQGFDVLDAPRQTEDATPRRLLSDEEADWDDDASRRDPDDDAWTVEETT